MTAASEPNPVVRDAVAFVDQTVLQSNAAVAEAMALLTRVHASALAVQGAAIHLREVSTVAVAAIGAALAQILAGDAERGTAALAATQQAMTNATAHLQEVLSLSQQVTSVTVPSE